MKAYEKYLLEDRDIPVNHIKDNDMGIISTGISELEQCKYRNQNKIVECLYYALCQLFDIDNMEMQTSNWGVSFGVIVKQETDFNNQKVLQSPELSRNKLINATPIEISKAIIDLIRDRKNWRDEVFYRKVKFD